MAQRNSAYDAQKLAELVKSLQHASGSPVNCCSNRDRQRRANASTDVSNNVELCSATMWGAWNWLLTSRKSRCSKVSVNTINYIGLLLPVYYDSKIFIMQGNGLSTRMLHRFIGRSSTTDWNVFKPHPRLDDVVIWNFTNSGTGVPSGDDNRQSALLLLLALGNLQCFELPIWCNAVENCFQLLHTGLRNWNPKYNLTRGQRMTMGCH